jgi:hypothetical protein
MLGLRSGADWQNAADASSDLDHPNTRANAPIYCQKVFFFRYTQFSSSPAIKAALPLNQEFPMPNKPSTTLPAVVEKVIPSPFKTEPEKAQIAVETADHLYREIRIENKLVDENGSEVRLKPGAQVEVTVEAPVEATIPKDSTVPE